MYDWESWIWGGGGETKTNEKLDIVRPILFRAELGLRSWIFIGNHICILSEMVCWYQFILSELRRFQLIDFRVPNPFGSRWMIFKFSIVLVPVTTLNTFQIINWGFDWSSRELKYCRHGARVENRRSTNTNPDSWSHISEMTQNHAAKRVITWKIRDNFFYFHEINEARSTWKQKYLNFIVGLGKFCQFNRFVDESGEKVVISVK